MSGIYINGMEMPKHCTECDFWHDGVFEHCLLNMEVRNEDVPCFEGEYPNGCPLVEVQSDDFVDRHEFCDMIRDRMTSMINPMSKECVDTPAHVFYRRWVELLWWLDHYCEREPPKWGDEDD